MRIQLDSSPTAPREARRFIHKHWQSAFAGAATTEADVVLVVSELVTNAVEAGARHLVLEIRAEAAYVELVVSDDAEGWPREQRPDPDDARGRGLFITTQLATHWNAIKDPRGKTITALWAREA